MTDEKNKEPERTPAPTPPPAPKKVTLRVSSPWCTSFTFPEHSGGTLVLTREGTEVDAKDAKALIETAAKHGVTLTEVSD